jgi:hypothetical protein
MHLMTLLITAGLGLAPRESARGELERLAGLIPCLPSGVVYYDREPSSETLEFPWLEGPELEALTLYADHRTSYARDDLISLLRHPDPKVRELAMCALYARLEPQVTLPLLHDLTKDDGAGFPSADGIQSAVFIVVGSPGNSKEELRARSLGKAVTVGAMAKKLIEPYTRAAWAQYTLDGGPSSPGWDAYWRERSGRDHCLSWSQVAVEHATGGTFPFQQDRRARITALRARIDTIPSPERQWELILLAQPDAHPLVSESERLAIAKGLGSKELMQFLRGEPPTDDPDMQTRETSDTWRVGLVMFLLDHAVELLEPKYADDLLALERKQFELEHKDEFSVVDSRWVVAAAKLQPLRAEGILIDALGRCTVTGVDGQDHRARILRALWEATGKKHLARILDWFFSEDPQLGAFGFGRQRFVPWLREGDSELLRTILQDPRLETLDPVTLQALARQTNALAGREVVPESRIGAMWHPYGLDRYSSMRDKAREEQPGPTQELEAEMTWIRASLRKYAGS